MKPSSILINVLLSRRFRSFRHKSVMDEKQDRYVILQLSLSPSCTTLELLLYLVLFLGHPLEVGESLRRTK